MLGSQVHVLNSITQAGPEAKGQVVVSGSHGGMIAGAIAAAAQLRGVVFNDAGVGKDNAGISSLVALQAMGMAAATVARRSAPMGDGQTMLRQGVISFANDLARGCGVHQGMPCQMAAALMHARAPQPTGTPFTASEGRHALGQGRTLARGCDSVTLVQAQDAQQILVIGSHAALHAGPASALTVQAKAAFFHDAGSWGEAQGLSRLPVLNTRGIAAAAVHHDSARIGDARSMFDTGKLSFCNPVAIQRGWKNGMSVQEAILRTNASQQPNKVPQQELLLA
jgi:hypothetical protein